MHAFKLYKPFMAIYVALCLLNGGVLSLPLKSVGSKPLPKPVAPKPPTLRTTARVAPSATLKPPTTSASLAKTTSVAAVTSASVPIQSSSVAVAISSLSSPSSSLVSSSAVQTSTLNAASTSATLASTSAPNTPSANISISTTASAPISSASGLTNATSSSNTTSSTNSTSCALPGSSTRRNTPVSRRFFDLLIDPGALFRREPEEFVGYHGTNGVNAQAYLKQGNSGGGIPVPPAFNGADAELGPGLYISDDIEVAQTFATGSAGSRAASGNTDPAATTPFVCVVTANSQTTWRNTIRKVWIPVASIATSVGGKNDPTKLTQQEQIIKQNGGTTDNTVRFSILDVARPNAPRSGNQMVLPSGVQSQLSIKNCAPVSNKQVSNLAADLGQPTFPAFSYLTQQTPWNIAGSVGGATCP